ncbi:MAG: N-acetylmuramoyl-L-alanine amidase [Phycisphaerales bacterium]|nr:N-acetylmuramoyl-L-alanine amidase [Phycisphaerales bacterium]
MSDHDTTPEPPEVVTTPSRRLFLVAGLGLLAGCATQRTAGPLPDPVWPTSAPPTRTASTGPASPIPTPSAPPVVAPGPAPMSGVIARAQWTTAAPVPQLMNRMVPVRYITVHHDGMSAFTSTSALATAQRLESIRLSHRGRDWGDIGYHFAVDPAGRVWEGRALGWQGAHVKDHNEGNIGIVMLGNFEEQRPTAAQISGLNQHLARLMPLYGVPTQRVRTHREWESAHTLCPGRHLQSYMVTARSNRSIA